MNENRGADFRSPYYKKLSILNILNFYIQYLDINTVFRIFVMF